MSQVTNTKNKDLTAAFVDNFEAYIDSQGENTFNPSELRKEAIEHFAKVGLPSNKHEDYKYTPITRLLSKAFSEADTLPKDINISSETKRFIQQQLLTTDAHHLVFVNGVFLDSLSNIDTLSDNLYVAPLSNVDQEYARLVHEHLAKEAKIGSDPFVTLNTAYAQDGCFVHVPKGRVVEKPIICYYFSDTSINNTIAHTRNLFVIEENAQVKTAEIFYSLGDSHSLSNSVTEVYVAKHANVHYYKFQNEGSQASHTGTTHVKQADDSHFHAVTVSLKGAIVRNNMNAMLDAKHCESHLYGLYMLDGNTHVDNHSIVDHQQPDSFSNELYKGIIDDKASGVFNGRIYVRPLAQKTNAFQSNANVLLSNNASIDTKPQLEIWADDVKCSHGATTGQLDKEQMFYLQTRGLSKTQARAVLLKAFAGDVVQHIEITPLKEMIEAEISKRLQS